MTNSTLIDFPCNFPIKIIGVNSQAFIDEVVKIAKKHDATFTKEALVQKHSKHSNYLAITLTLVAIDQVMLDALYSEISIIPGIKMVL
ncbi:MAG: DUF493 domain-containing protein [Legionella sp.]|nr:DUF493 domain-containing protein [Legionella sp.]